MSRGVLDIFLIYQFLKRLVTPFEKWDAYKVGMIDKEGHVIVDKEKRTKEQEDSWGYYERLVANLKKLLGKIPGGKSRIASFAAALLLLREHDIDPDDTDYLNECLKFYMREAEELIEDGIPTNIAGTGNIAGIGVGPKGEPGISAKVIERHRKKNKKQKDIIMGLMDRLQRDGVR